MRALRDTQADLLAAVLGRDPAHAARWPRHRLAVYRNNARENFAAALEAAFPLLHGLMGHDEFRAMAWTFQKNCPPRSGNLFYCGAGLTDFLAARLAKTLDEPLTDVARFEWLIQEALVAADELAHFDFGKLAALPQAQHGSLRFRCHPATRLYLSTLPIFTVWRDYQHRGTVTRTPMNVAAGTEALLIQRARDGVELHRLQPAEFCFLDTLMRGECLEAAIDNASAGDTSLDPGTLLSRWVSAGVITGLAD